MPLNQPVTPGSVDWTGENPGILLKDEAGNFTAMALFFRVAWSPAGQGQVLLLYGTPDRAEGTTEAPNLIFSDNADLTAFLKENFISKLAAFANAPAFATLPEVTAHAVRFSGDPMGPRYTETVAGGEHVVELVWEDLEPPLALELDPDLTGTKAHTMFTLLVPARSARIIVNGRALPGAPGARVQAGMETSTAFLYFSETWITPPEGA